MSANILASPTLPLTEASHAYAPQIRERVWQTLKDVKAMEQHVRQQNALNEKMREEIEGMASGAEREKKVIRLLIDDGMKGVSDRIDLLRDAVDTNVTGVKDALRHLDDSLVRPVASAAVGGTYSDSRGKEDRKRATCVLAHEGGRQTYSVLVCFWLRH